MTTTPTTTLAKVRERVQDRHNMFMAALDGLDLPLAVADRLAKEWEASGEGRAAFVRFDPDSTFHSMLFAYLEFTLPRGSLFPEAADIFERAERDLLAAFPAEWSPTSDEEVKDATYSATLARRGVTIKAEAPGRPFPHSVWLSINVAIPVAAGDACKVVKVRDVYHEARPAVASYRTAEYRSECPADAVLTRKGDKS